MKFECFKNYDRRTRIKLEKMKWIESKLDLSKEMDKLIVPKYWTWELLSSGKFVVPIILLNVKIMHNVVKDLSKKSSTMADLYNNNIKRFYFFRDNDVEVDDPILIIRQKETIRIIDGNHRVVGYCMRDDPPVIDVLEGRL